MLGNNEMEIDNPVAATSLEESLPVSELVKSEIIEISDVTPVKKGKKRRISETGNEEGAKKSSNINNLLNSIASPAPNTPTAPTTSNSIRADMKRLLQSQDSEIAKYYQIKSNNKLVLIQGQVGEAPYRHHPDTIKELMAYFDDLKQENFKDPSFNFVSFLKEKHSGLISKLVQDSQVSQSELLTSIRTILIPVASEFPDFQIDSSLLDGIVEKVSYGHPDAGNNFTAWSCTFWQVKDVNMLGGTIGKHFLTNFVIRNAARMILENCLKEMTTIEQPVNVTVNVDDLPMNLMKIESGTGTPKKREKEKKEKSTGNNVTTATSSSAAATATATTAPSVPKISSFFAKLKKPEGVEKVTRVTGEYFQPFFVKPDVTLAPHNQLKLLKTQSISDCSNCVYDSPSDFWREFNIQRVRIPFKKPTCLCVGYDGRPIRAVLKLLKFEENYRPAYLGTWRKVVPAGSVSARRPFGRIPEVDYDYDSDAEWDEGEDPEGESLSDLDDEEDEEDEDDLSEDELENASNRSCTGSVDSWLVPHGYLSDDEGVADEIHLGELEDAAREAELMPPPPKKKDKEKKKFVPKEPILLGPFFGDQVIPQILQSNTLQFIGDSMISNNNPFLNYEAVFSNLESSSSSSSTSASKLSSSSETSEKNPIFPEVLLPSMIQIINTNPSAGITKLYDEFTLQHGKAVSRRLFESKLNQITLGKMKCEKTGKLRWIFKEEYNTVANGPSVNSFDNSNVMIID